MCVKRTLFTFKTIFVSRGGGGGGGGGDKVRDG